MDPKSLRAFLALADALHFGRAAGRCHLSPSALSRLVQRLEAEVGVALFLRDNRRVALTPAGRLFRDYARDALQRWEDCRQSLRAGGTSLSGEIRLFCSVTASYHFLSHILPRFRARHPGIEIHLHTGDQAESVQRVLAGDEDLAIAARGDHWPQRLAFLPVASTPLVFILPAVAGLVRERATAPGGPDWGGLPLIVAEQGLSRERVDHWFRAAGIRPNVYAQVAGHEAIVSMVSLGYGVGVVPQLVLDNSPLREQVEVWAGAPALAGFAIGVCCLQRSLGHPLVQAFWAEAEQAFAGSGWRRAGPTL